MKKEDEIPKRPEWIPLKEKFGCYDCSKRCKYRKYSNLPSVAILECKRNGVSRVYQFCVNGVSAIPLLFLFRKLFYAFSGKYFFLPLLILVIIVFFYDSLWIFIEKRTELFFEKREERRRHKYDEQIKQIEILEEQKRQKEAEAEAKKKVSSEEIKLVQNLHHELKKLQDLDAIQANFSERYEEMLKALKEICDELCPEEFLDNTLKSLFKVYLPEFLETCQSFVFQYDKGILTEQEMALFEKLLKTAKERLVRVKRFMCEQDKTELYINMAALEEVFSISNEKGEAK